MPEPIDQYEDLIQGNDWTSVTGDVEYTFLNPGYLPSYWTDGFGGLEGWLDQDESNDPDKRFEDDASLVDDFSVTQRKVTHFYLGKESDLVGSSGENLKSLDDSYFENIYYRVSFSDVANITFDEKLHLSGSPNDVGQIAMATAEQDDPDALLGHGRFPGSTDDAGDVILGNVDNISSDGDITTDYDSGEVGPWLILHELGHAVGLLHADETANFDNQKYSIMSYESHDDMNGGLDFLRPSGLQILDIIALQDIYGTNYNTRNEDTTYSLGYGFGFYSDPENLPAGAEDNPFIYTIWDGAGEDHIDASDYDDGVQIDLRQGRFSSIGKTETGTNVLQDAGGVDYGNVAIAYDVVIEEATGGDGIDFLVGNSWENVLTGGKGNDRLYGDGFVFDGNYGIEESGSSDGDAPTNSEDDDVLDAGEGVDESYGGRGDDTFIAIDKDNGMGARFLEGDLYHGGGIEDENFGGTTELTYSTDGYDTVDYSAVDLGEGIKFDLTDNTASTAYSWDSVADTTSGTADSLKSIEGIIGTDENDKFLPTEGVDNTLDGGNGQDVIDFSSYSSGLTIDLNGLSGTGNDTLIDIEDVVGTGYDDEIHGVEGELNSIDGGNGFDLISYESFSTAVTVNLANSIDADGDTITSIEGAIGTDYDDIFIDKINEFNEYHGGDGEDVFYDADGEDDYYGNADNDTVDFSLNTEGVIFWTGASDDVTVDSFSFSPFSYGNIIDYFVSVEDVIGTDYDDTFITGNYDSNRSFDGGDGDFDHVQFFNQTEFTFSSDIATDEYSNTFENMEGFQFLQEGPVDDFYFGSVNLIDEKDNSAISGNFDPSLIYKNSDGNYELLTPEVDETYHHLLIVSPGGTVISDVTGSGVRADDFTSWGVGTGDDDTINGDLGDLSRDDVLNGNGGADIISGGDGDDEINGGAGNDTLNGNDDDDTLFGGSGVDSLSGGAGADALRGGVGNDNLYGGDDSDTYLWNIGDGDDTVTDSDGTNDVLELGAGIGAEDLVFTVNGSDLEITFASIAGEIILTGHLNGAGTQQIEKVRFDNDLELDLAYYSDWTFGTNGSETISGDVSGDTDDVIFGLDGNDTIHGYDENDILVGGNGKDTLYGGNDNDIVVGGYGAQDRIDGDGGNDILYDVSLDLEADFNLSLDAGNADQFYGDSGDDILYQQVGDASMSGGTGDDTYVIYFHDDSEVGSEIQINAGSNAVNEIDVLELRSLNYSNPNWHFEFGFDGSGANFYNELRLVYTGTTTDTIITIDQIRNVANDDVAYSIDEIVFADNFSIDFLDLSFVIEGTDSAETVNGDSSANYIISHDGGDTVYAGDDDDFVYGGIDDDIIYGGNGDDVLMGSAGNDSIYGEAGNDHLSGWNDDDVLYGGDGNDVLHGFSGADILYGGDGDDELYGGGDNDILDGGAGNDVMNGSSQDDTYYYISGLDEINELKGDDVIYIQGGVSIEDLSFAETGNWDVTITIDSGVDEIEMGHVRQNANRWPETLIFDDAFETDQLPNYASWLNGTTGNDSVSGNSNDNVLIGNDGNDTLDADGGHDDLHGGSGDDILYGDAGNDFIHGGIDDDDLYGGAGTDILYGGDGADSFYFESGLISEVDEIRDFSTAQDDAINIADILTGYDFGVDDITEWVQITDNGTDSTLSVDADGGADSFVSIATITGVTGLTDEADLETNGYLIAA